MSKPTDITATLRCKVAIVGDSMVGKSALVSMFKTKSQKFPKDYLMTSGVEVSVVEIVIPDTTVAVELYLYDTSGNDVYKDQLAAYWNGIYHIILVYDVSNLVSFNSCKQWLEAVKQARVLKEQPLKIVLVATKTDLPVQRHQVNTESAEKLAQSVGAQFIKTAAAPPGEAVDQPFLAIAKALHKSYEDQVTAFKGACGNYN